MEWTSNFIVQKLECASCEISPSMHPFFTELPYSHRRFNVNQFRVESTGQTDIEAGDFDD